MMENTIRAFTALWDQDEVERNMVMPAESEYQHDEPEADQIERMFTDLINLFGLEAPTVVNFALLMEQGAEFKSLKLIYEIITDYPELYMYG